jgi:DNA polymerase-3 subunit delta'
MISFSEFLATSHQYKHHALLLISKQFEYANFPDTCFQAFAKNFCGISLESSSPEHSLFDVPSSDLFVADRLRKILRKEDVSKMKTLCFYKPIQASRRLFYIENCQRLSHGAANSLLKILEEPPSQCLFLLTAKSLDYILPTILSRCQKIFCYFNEIPKKTVCDLLLPEDFQILKNYVNRFKNTVPKCFEFETTSLSFLEMHEIVENSEKLSKKYSAAILRDVLVFLASEKLKADHQFLQSARFLREMISQWREAEFLHVSCFLWLTKILLAFQDEGLVV